MAQMEAQHDRRPAPRRPDPEVVNRQRALVDLRSQWMRDHPGQDPDDSDDYHDQVRKLLGLPPLT